MRGYACALLSFCTGYTCEMPVPEGLVLPEERKEPGQPQLLSDITLFPNPNDGNWVVQCPTLLQEQITCQIVSPEGQLIKSLDFINTGHYQIREGTLPNGIYLERLSHAGSTVYQGRIIVLR